MEIKTMNCTCKKTSEYLDAEMLPFWIMDKNCPKHGALSGAMKGVKEIKEISGRMFLSLDNEARLL